MQGLLSSRRHAGVRRYAACRSRTCTGDLSRIAWNGRNDVVWTPDLEGATKDLCRVREVPRCLERRTQGGSRRAERAHRNGCPLLPDALRRSARLGLAQAAGTDSLAPVAGAAFRSAPPGLLT